MGKAKATAKMSPVKKAKSAVAGVPSVASLGNLTGGSSSIPPRVYDENINIAVLNHCTNGSVYDDKVFPAADMYAVSLATGCHPSPLFWTMNCQELYGKSTQESAIPQPIDSESFWMAYQTKLEFVGQKKMRILMRLAGAKTGYVAMSERRQEKQRRISRSLSCI